MKHKFFWSLVILLLPNFVISQTQKIVREGTKNQEIIAIAKSYLKRPQSHIVSKQMQNRVNNEFNIDSNQQTPKSTNPVHK